MSTDATPVLAPDLAQAGPLAFATPNRMEARGFAEGARVGAMLAGSPNAPGAGPAIEARDDPAAGLTFVLKALGATTIVAIHPDTGMVKARWLDAATLADVAAWAASMSAAGFNLYFTPNLPAPGMERKAAKADMSAVRAVFADVDAKGGQSLEGARAAVLALPPPSFIIASGGGFQPVWVLDAPMPATPDVVAAVEAVGRRLAALAGGDPVQNVDRILRLPFTVNYPNATKRAAGRGVSLSGLLREAAQ